MAVRLIIADEVRHTDPIREMFWEYLEWANSRLIEEFAFKLDIAAVFPEDKQKAVNEYARVTRAGGYVGLNEGSVGQGTPAGADS